MAIEELVAFIPPREEPIDGEGDWGAAEAELGISFPSDFRALIRRYGTGEFFGRLPIANPLTAWGRAWIGKQLKGWYEFRNAAELDLAFHPERPGLFPWGRDTNGNSFFWLTKGAPDRWPIIQLQHGRAERPHRANATITTFLVRYAQNRYPTMLGGVKFDESKRRFTVGLPWER
jgi:hypothetical protein